MTKPRTDEKFKREVGRHLMGWDTSDVVSDRLKFLKENWGEDHPGEEMPGDDSILAGIYEDQDVFTWEWEYLTDYLTEVMQERNPGGEWRVSVNDFGWRKQDGFKEFKAGTGVEFLRKILPDTDCTFKIFAYGDDGIAVQNFHHDAPTGEIYYCWPKGEAVASIVEELMAE